MAGGDKEKRQQETSFLVAIPAFYLAEEQAELESRLPGLVFEVPTQPHISRVLKAQSSFF